MLIGFWAFGALTQAHADALPSPSALSQQARSGLGGAAHPVRTTVPHLVRTAPVHATVERIRRTARRPVRTTVERVRPLRLARRLGLPQVAMVPKAAGRPVAGLRGTARADTSGSPQPRGDDGCHPPPAGPPPLHRVASHAAKAAPAVRDRPRRPATEPGGVTPAQRIKPTGTITRAPRPRVERIAPAVPMPAPISGAGGSDDSGGKTSSGTGDMPRIRLPGSGLWSIASQPAVTASRIIADKPSFSPD